MRKVIGVDLGGTCIAAGLIDEEGKILRETRRDSGADLGRDLVLERIREVVDELMSEEVEAIGLGTPGFVDIEKGEILSISGNIKNWAHTKVKEELERYYDLPIYIDNDANLAGVCEAWIGSGKNLDSFVMITLGTGVGGAIYSKKYGIWYGSNYEGAELGHTIMYPNGRECRCGQKGCVERYISGRGIEENYKELTGNFLPGEEIFRNITRNQDARRAVDKFMDDLVVFLISIKNIFDPEGIIIGGGVINSREYWWERVEDRYRKNCNSPGPIKILPAKYLNHSGMIGAARGAFLKI